MTKLVRGRIIAEAKETKDTAPMAGVSLTPLDLSDPEDYEDELDDEEYGKTELLPERDGASFATAAMAPWVGAEKVCRSGAIPPPHPRHTHQIGNDRKRDKTPLELVLSESEVSSALSAGLPSKQRSYCKKQSLRLLSYAAVAAISVVLTWMVTRRDAKPAESQIIVPLTEAKSPYAADSTLTEKDESGCIGDNAHASCGVKSEQDNSQAPEKNSNALDGNVSSFTMKQAKKSKTSFSEESGRWSDKRPRTKSVDRQKVKHRIKASPEKAPEADKKEMPTTASLSTDATGVKGDSPAIGKESEAGVLAVNTAKEIDHGEVSVEDKPDRTAKILDHDPSMNSPKQSLSRAQVKKTVERIASEVRKCRRGVSGRVVVEFVVAGNSGRVVSARAVDQTAVGATAGQCAAQVVQLLTFPTFEKSRLTIKYPFDL